MLQPSQVGIQLSSIGFNTFVGDVMIAPVASTGPVNLAPGSTSRLALAGRLVPQDSPVGLATVSDVFNNFVHGKDSNVVVHGASAGSGDVRYEATSSFRAILMIEIGYLAQRRHQKFTSSSGTTE